MMIPPTIKSLLKNPLPSTSSLTVPHVQVNGWIKSIRRQKRVAFAVISDGSNTTGLQAVFNNVEQTKRYVDLPLILVN